MNRALCGLGAVLVAVSLVLAACSSDSSESDEQTTTSTEAETTTTESDDTTTTTEDEGDSDAEPTDYLTFAQGAVPVSATILEGAGSDVTLANSIELIDGDPTGRIYVNDANDETSVEYVYELPAETTFDRFAVPEILEVPSPSETFARQIEVSGSSESADAGFEVLTSAELEIHDASGEVTELPEPEATPVRWIKITLTGAIDTVEGTAALDFSELIGNGTQEPVELVDAFSGIWDTYLPDTPERSTGLIELKQDGAIVTGCYENSDLTGTVTGNLAHVQGVDRDDGVISLFVLNVAADGSLQGVASFNNAPFEFFPGNVAPEGTTTDCSDVPEPENPLGCDSVVHGINFEFDSAELRSDSEPVLQQLYEGLEADGASTITIEGHTSTEGDEAYNQDLSERRAQAVVDDLVARGIDPSRISAVGMGETEPLVTPEEDETARSLNRRVEITCG